MLFQTVSQIMPVLRLLQQPAFCVCRDASVICNAAADSYAPTHGALLPTWLGAGYSLYCTWDGETPLLLSLSIEHSSCNAVIHKLEDGTLFLLSPDASHVHDAECLSATAQVLRHPLSELTCLMERLSEDLEEMEDPLMQEQSAAITKQIYRMNRIVGNLADLELLRSGRYTVRMEKIDLLEFLCRLTDELTDICSSIGRSLTCHLPQNTVFISADPALLERAIFNLMSNALRYSPDHTPIVFRVRISDSACSFFVENICPQTSDDLFAAAFHRMHRRGDLPDPDWGVGLGLPLVRQIAQLMGGTAALTTKPDGTVAAALSICRKKSLTQNLSQDIVLIDRSGGLRRVLVELSDVLPTACFDSTVL